MNKPWDIGKVGVSVINASAPTSAGVQLTSSGSRFFKPQAVQPTGPAHGDMRRLHDGTIEMYDGANWINVSPNQMTGVAPVTPTYTLDLDAEPVDALALAIYKTYEAVPGANLPASRKAAADVVRTLGELGFVLTQDHGSVTTNDLEDDFDFTDICGECVKAEDACVEWFQLYDGRPEFAPPAPDRFCLFHRGWVMGKLA